MRHGIPTIFLALALLGCNGASKTSKTTEPPPPTNESGAIEFTFAWPTDLSGSVARENSEQRGDEPEQKSSVVYTVETSPAENGVQLTYSNPREAKVPGASPEELAAMAPMFEAVPTIVMRDGAVVEIGNADAMRAVVDELAPIPESAPPDVKAKMEATRSDAFFLQAAQSEWATLTTVWHGKALRPKEKVEARTQTQMLGLPTKIETVVRMSLDEQLPCPGDAERQCVRLVYSSTPDPASLKAATESLVHDAARNGVKFEVQTLVREYEVELITEPSTLIPYEFSSREYTALEATQDGQPASNKQVKTRREKYTWTRD